MNEGITSVLRQLDIQAGVIGNDLCTQGRAAAIIRCLMSDVDRLTRERDDALEGWHVVMPNAPDE